MLILLLVAAGLCGASRPGLPDTQQLLDTQRLLDTQDRSLGEAHNRIEDLVLKVLENIRSQMTTGIEEFNIPPLEPFVIESKTVDLELKEISVKGGITDLVIPGLSGFQVEDLTVELAEGKIGIALSLPDISANGQYDLKGTIKTGVVNLPLEGQGELTADVKGITLNASAAFGISPVGQITLDNFDLFWNLTDIKLQLGGLYNDTAVGKLINRLLADTLPRLVTQTYHDKITELAVKTVNEQGAAYLADLHKDHGTPPDAVRDSVQDTLQLQSQQDVVDELKALAQDVGEGRATVDVELEAPGSRHRRSLSSSLLSSFIGEVQLLGEPRFFQHGALSTQDAGEGRAVVDVEREAPGSRHRRSLSSSLLSSFIGEVQLLGEPRFFQHGALSSEDADEEYEEGRDEQGEQGTAGDVLADGIGSDQSGGY